MSPLASCEMGVWVGAHNAEVVGGAVVHGVEVVGGDAVVHGAEVVGGDAVAHDVVGEGDGGVHGVVGEGDGGGVHGAVGEGGGGVHSVVREGDGGVHGVVGEEDGGDVHGVVGEGDGSGVDHGVEVESDVLVQIVGVVVEVGGKTVEVGVCKVHVQNAAQEGNKALAGNDHWVKSRHLGHHGIAMQDKENMFLIKPAGSMAMIKP